MLLDENLPRRLKQHLDPDLEVLTVRERGWSGKKNGVLLRDTAAEFDAFITTDRGIPHQQNYSSLSIGIVLLEAPSNRLQDLLPMVPKINTALATVQPGQLVRVSR